MKVVIACVVLASFTGCKKKESAAPAPGSAAPAAGSAVPTGSAAAAGSADSAGSAVAAQPAPPAADPGLPLSADVLPHDEATPNTRVVVGDGFRYQVPEGFTQADHGGTAAYTGAVKGIISDATLTFWASSEPFKGSLDDLVARETKEVGDSADVGPVMVLVSGDLKMTGYAKRVKMTIGDAIEQRTLVVHNGKAYIHHCATPNVSNAWANVGSDCVTRSTTFHVAPPPLEAKHAPNPAGPPPETPNVGFMGSKVEGTARQKKDVKNWLEEAMPYVKPCFKDAANGTQFRVSFELAKDGKVGIPTVETGTDTLTPVDAAISSCVTKALEPQKMDGAADAAVKVSTTFMLHAPY